jgi:hypothetical protein
VGLIGVPIARSRGTRQKRTSVDDLTDARIKLARASETASFCEHSSQVAALRGSPTPAESRVRRGGAELPERVARPPIRRSSGR